MNVFRARRTLIWGVVSIVVGAALAMSVVMAGGAVTNARHDAEQRAEGYANSVLYKALSPAMVGQPIDGKGPIASTRRARVDVKAPGIIPRKSVNEQVFSGSGVTVPAEISAIGKEIKIDPATGDLTLADGLNKVGFITWFGQRSATLLAGHSPLLVLVALVGFFFVVHYLFASLTAHTTAVLPVVLAAGAAIPGMPVRTLALLLVFSIGIMGVLTPYATGPAPVYYGCGYIGRRDFWRLGFIFGLIFLAALLLIGLVALLGGTAAAPFIYSLF